MFYDYKKIEKKWQQRWDELHVFDAVEDPTKEKFYALVEFPYPSGQGLHVGHPRPYTALDIMARSKRLQGYNVMYPMGWDAFGLPTENYAMKTGIHPRIVTEKNVAHFKQQMKDLGYSFSWNREVNTTDPEYYKWTQWIFIQLYKHGLAYKKEFPINFCTSCKVGLANEEVVNGRCERCGGEVVRKIRNQWMLKITAYAQRLIDDLDTVDYVERVKTSQINWIGRSEGAQVRFPLEGKDDSLEIYTTRPDTIYGVTYMVISPEHPFIEKYASDITNMDEVRAYQEECARKSDFERTEMAKEKTLTYKGRPLRRKENLVYYGDMSDKYIVMLQIMETEPLQDLALAKRVSVQLQLTDPDIRVRDRVVKKAEKEGFYIALDLGAVWLERALASA